MYILIVGLNHKTAPVEIREKLTFTKTQIPQALKELHSKEDISSCIILATCNRTEIYATVHDLEKGLSSIKDFMSSCCSFNKKELRQYLYVKTLNECVRHLFSVVSGLDSMVLGETQILGQAKEAYEEALKNKTTSGVLNALFKDAITVGKRVRTETQIDQNAVSISYVAVELAKQVFEDLSKRTVLVLGAGEMSRLTAKHLLANGVSTIMVSNRSFDRAVAMAEEFKGKAVKFDELFNYMVSADIVITATAARHHIITAQDMAPVMKKRNDKTILMIDIALPRDIEPEAGSINGIELYDIDGMKNVVDKNLEERKRRAEAAEEIIEEELDNFFKWLNTLLVVPTIVALQEKAEKIKDQEFERAKNRLEGFTEREEKVLGSMVNSIIKQLIHDPIIVLKDQAASGQGHLYSDICQSLFNLDISDKVAPSLIGGQQTKIVNPDGNINHIKHEEDGDKLEKRDYSRNQGQPTGCLANQLGTGKTEGI